MPVKKTLRKLVLFYSHTGGTRYIAQAIANAAGADLVEIKTLKPLSTFKPWLILSGGFQAVSGRKPKIQPLPKKPETYDLIFIGTPIWASRFAPALRTWLAEAGLKGKRLALFASSGGVLAAPTMARRKESQPPPICPCISCNFVLFVVFPTSPRPRRILDSDFRRNGGLVDVRRPRRAPRVPDTPGWGNVGREECALRPSQRQLRQWAKRL